MSAGIARVLSIAGTDPTGGAGIHADLKSISANGGYGMAVVTALVAQNTRGVRALHVPPAPFLGQQLTAVSDDVVIDAVKIGMLANAETITTVSSWLLEVQPPVVVLDPVMIATSGDRLLDAAAGQALKELLPLADLVTPNVPELADLLGTIPATTWEAVLGQARELARRHDVIVLAKGGHLDGADVRDALVNPDGTATEYVASRVLTENTHGTGCSLSSAIAPRRAAGDSWPEAVRNATEWLGESLRRADELDVGRGHGPVHHFAGLWSRGGLDTAPTPDDVRSSWWSSISGTRTAIDDLAFIRQLGDGTLPTAAFRWYLAQDTLYLREYARALGRAGGLAPSSADRPFWAGGAEEALTAEMALHEGGVPPADADGTLPSDATTAYLGHLADVATGGDYGELIAALLPCYWLYRDVGQRLHALSHDEHPFRDWLDTYADPSFAEATDLAIDIVTATAARATSATRARMLQAFQTSAEHELAF
ncbi:hydroxymethylpyrimidine kinase [Frigoribacterium sp. RIT-PI-h]|nr:bifunctional hydroxymethylpyrimidine kinase/phosphomethylpyrimidine kinase [Frigoribacterium sp. RIT-PI-h]KPG82423.1 hydroxymethylpyrimidine kinase [Frigoribacterium sp. RIT-PI-h]